MTKEIEMEIIEYWGQQGEKVISACKKANKIPMSFDDFADRCYACGGSIIGMMLSGILNLYPEVWQAIPNEMGDNAIYAICDVLKLLDIK